MVKEKMNPIYSMARDLKPEFWDKKPHLSGSLFNYRRIWMISVFLAVIVSLVPLVAISTADLKTTENAIASEVGFRIVRTVSNTNRAISFFLTERRAALNFIARDNSEEELKNTARLVLLLEGLQESFGCCFVDLAVIDESGKQIRYVGPYALEGKDYKEQPWLTAVIDNGAYVSDVFLGFRNRPHFVVAVKKPLPMGRFLVLRASVDVDPFEKLLSKLELTGRGDAFIVNHAGVLQTNSRYYGQVLQKMPLPIPKYEDASQVIEWKRHSRSNLLIGYRFIEESPFILMVVKEKEELMMPWQVIKKKIFFFLLGSTILIIAVILGIVTYMVQKIYQSDEKRLISLHQIEYASKMATIGRMAASVSHEINNPLAIINEKAGLIKDLFEIKNEYENDARLLNLIDSILAAVKRAAKITKRLLSFSRNMESSADTIDVRALIGEVLSFVEKEAEFNSIDIRVDAPNHIPLIRSDRGKLQQIFLNIINNALEAMKTGGHLSIEIYQDSKKYITAKTCDDGCGIAPDDLPHIFEPFFSTKSGRGGTGLGLSVTYSLVQEIGGTIGVESQLGVGTCFTVTLPLRKVDPMEDKNRASTVGG